MSSVQDETETGLKEDVEDARSEHASRVLEKSLEKGDSGTSPVPSIAEIPGDVAHGNSFADSQAGNQTSPGGELKPQKDEEDAIYEDSGPVPGKANEKPSSADGSLSTPDDTPSIQVRWRYTCHD